MRFRLAARARRAGIFMVVLLVIEFLDEFTFGIQQAAWPLIRTDLELTYTQIGLLFAVPALFANLIEPAIGILGDVWRRRVLVIGGGVMFSLAFLLTSVAPDAWVLMIAFMIGYPASGAFVGLAQSTLMDLQPDRHEQNMARWTFAGSVGIVVGTISVGVFVPLGVSWRTLFLVAAILSLLVTIYSRSFQYQGLPGSSISDEQLTLRQAFTEGLRGAGRALRRREVIRWLTLLQFSDLMLDVLHGYLALYFADVVGLDPVQAGVSVLVWTGVGLVGDLAIIPLLERINGLTYLRYNAIVVMVVFAAFLLVPNLIIKLILLGVLGFLNAGWYAILQGKLYSTMPGQSAIVITVGVVSGLIGSMMPLFIGLMAERVGLGNALWFIMLAPIALIIGIPRQGRSATPTHAESDEAQSTPQAEMGD